MIAAPLMVLGGRGGFPSGCYSMAYSSFRGPLGQAAPLKSRSPSSVSLTLSRALSALSPPRHQLPNSAIMAGNIIAALDDNDNNAGQRAEIRGHYSDCQSCGYLSQGPPLPEQVSQGSLILNYNQPPLSYLMRNNDCEDPPSLFWGRNRWETLGPPEEEGTVLVSK